MNAVSQFRAWIFAATLFVISTGVAGAQPAVSATALDMARFQLFCPNAITQNFPTSGPAVTTWLICWHEIAGNNSIADPNGLIIAPVYFRQSPSSPFVRILSPMRVSYYFV